MTEIEPRCAPIVDGWRCQVAVRDDAGAGEHEVTVAALDAERLAAATTAAGVERLVFETFDFLLEREPRGSILQAFDITVVGRYFPEYDDEIRSRLAP